jgi:hypothetical protein
MKYKGRELANPIVIIRRLIAYPFLYMLRIIYCAVLVLGWGWDSCDVERIWNDML